MHPETHVPGTMLADRPALDQDFCASVPAIFSAG